MRLCARLDSVFSAESWVAFSDFFFFLPAALFDQFKCTVHGSHKLHFSAIFSLKMGPTILFIHLKIILLR